MTSSTVVARTRPTPDRGATTLSRRHPDGRWTIGLLVAAAVAGAAWLPFLHAPLTSDESGFLLLARHWAPGTSLYGDYWVDRPPLLLWLFTIAGRLGHAGHTSVGLTDPAVKLLGAGASYAAVLLTGALGALIAPASRWPRWAGPVLATALLADPLFGMPETDGEVLAVPFVLLGLVCLIGALRRPWGSAALGLAGSAGAAAMAAALVKQNVVDVFVFALVTLVLARGRVDRVLVRAGAFAAGGAAVLGGAVAAAAVRGTSPAGLWDAVVTFRLQASAVIGSAATESTSERLSRLGAALLGSGAAAVLVVAAVLALVARHRARRRAGGTDSMLGAADLVWPALAMVAWEACGVAAGGSYWLHYLTGLVPGLVLLVGLARPTRRGALVLGACLVYAIGATATTWTRHAVAPAQVSSDAQVVSYLRDHATATDGLVVAFGHPDIVAGSGLASPYEHLWSLPVRVRDPRLTGLQRILAGPAAPRWVVVAGDGLASWGLDAQAAQQYLGRHYVDVRAYGEWHVWHRQDARAAPR